MKPTERRQGSKGKSKGSMNLVGFDPVTSVAYFDLEVVEHNEDLT